MACAKTTLVEAMEDIEATEDGLEDVRITDLIGDLIVVSFEVTFGIETPEMQIM